MLFHAHSIMHLRGLTTSAQKSQTARGCNAQRPRSRGQDATTPARRRPKRRQAAVPLRRSDLVYTKQLSFAVTGTQLDLHTQLVGVSETVGHPPFWCYVVDNYVYNLHRTRIVPVSRLICKWKAPGVLITMSASPSRARCTSSVGHAWDLAHGVSTPARRCATADQQCTLRIAPTQVWLNSRPRAAALESDDADEIIFPAGANELDLGPCVVDALVLALPGALTCGASGCMAGATAGVGLDGQGSGWRVGGSSSNGAFAALAALRQQRADKT